MKSEETENKTERTRELIRGMDQAGKEIALAIESFKGLSLAAINMLLAGDEFFNEDLLQQLKDEKGILDRHYVEADDNDVDEDNRHTKATMKLSDAVSSWPTGQIEELSGYLTDHSLEDILQIQAA